MTQDLPRPRALGYMWICYKPVLEVMGNFILWFKFDKPLSGRFQLCVHGNVLIFSLTS